MRISLLISCTTICLAWDAKALEPISLSPTAVEMPLVEFRIVAKEPKYASVIEAASKQEAKEDADKRPHQALVGGSKKGQAIGKWVRVDDQVKNDYAANPNVIVREATSDGTSVLELLTVIDEWNITNTDFASIEAGNDDQGRPCVEFSMTRKGANSIAQLTGSNVPDSAGNRYALGIIVEGRLVGAPNINSTITDRGLITGKFSEQEVKDLVKRLNETIAKGPKKQK